VAVPATVVTEPSCAALIAAEQVQRLLECACEKTKPLYAIAAFAGLRWIEIERLV